MSSSSDSSSASSSSGEEEDDAATQKSRIEESGGGGGTAEEGGEEASSPDRGDEILLPWKTQVHFPRLKQRVKLSKFLLESCLISSPSENKISSARILLFRFTRFPRFPLVGALKSWWR